MKKFSIKNVLLYTGILAVTALILIHTSATIEYAKKGLGICYEIIIPSLFPFFICSGLLIYSGFSQLLSKVLGHVMKPLFRINGSGGVAFTLGIISGYPLGAITTCELYEAGYCSKTESERLLAFCNNSGPLFILGSVGISLYHSPLIGWMMYIAHLLAAITVGIVFRFYKRDQYLGIPAAISQPKRTLGEVFSIVIQNSIKNILTVCGVIIFFSVIANLLINTIPAGGIAGAVFAGLIEFVTGVVGVSNSTLGLAQKLVVSSFIVGFAGLSVHFQVMGVVAQHGLSLKPYVFGKFLHGLIAALYMLVFLQIIPVAQSVFGPIQSPMIMDSNGAFAVSALYVLTTVLCIIVLAVVCGISSFISRSGRLKRRFRHCASNTK